MGHSKTETKWNDEQVDDSLSRELEDPCQTWFSNLHYKAVDNKTRHEVKQQILKTFVLLKRKSKLQKRHNQHHNMQ
jgi:hypothetical protein